MAGRYTYEIKTVGPKRSVIVYENGSKVVYNGAPSFTATNDILLQEAKTSLKNQFIGNPGDIYTEIDNMTLTAPAIPLAPPTNSSSNQSQINQAGDPNSSLNVQNNNNATAASSQANLQTQKVATTTKEKAQLAKEKEEQLKSQAIQSVNKLNEERERLQNRIKTTKEQVEKIAAQQRDRLKNIRQSIDNKVNFVKQISSMKAKDLRILLSLILIPILLGFLRAENIANLLIKKLTKDTKDRIKKSKGTLTIVQGTFIFTPPDDKNYQQFKTDFDRRVNIIRRPLQTLQKIITLLNNVIKILQIALTLISIYIMIKRALNKGKMTAALAELASPSQSKPTAGATYLSVIISEAKLTMAERRIEEIQSVLGAANIFLPILRTFLSKILARLDQLQFIITTAPKASGVNTDLSVLPAKTAPSEELYTDINGKEYLLKLIILPNGAKQYQAIEAFSRLKVAQTAPSFVKNESQLLDEIKQIIG
jgi:hypothetical protein